jgi:endo-1,4-beta-D-glucanase Y/sortase (surface protein transpeptidase)
MRRTPVGALGAFLLVGTLALAGCSAQSSPTGESAAPTPSASNTATADQVAQDFLRTYVENGRIIRRDQGNDTVSEGQAYGMLLAVSVNDKASFGQIWDWTKKNLQRPDGLMAWDWKNGAVIDSEPASDADLDMARALVEAGTKFNDPTLTASGNTLGSLVLDKLTVTTAAGRILLPGLWAAATTPYAYNPSYASPAAFSELGASTKDPRWAELATGSRAVTKTLLDKSALPPDWAQVHQDGTVDQMPAPQQATSGTGTVEYSYDAARMPIRYAESCDPADTDLAAQLAGTLSRSGTLTSQLDLGGTGTTTETNPVSYTARAAALAAAGQNDKAKTDLQTAATLNQTTPTYYGAAWTALSRQMLETTNLGSCPPLTTATGGLGANQDPQPGSATAASARDEGLVPVRVQIPDIGVDSGLESLSRDSSGWIQPPVKWASAGWYQDGVVPGDTGPAVIAGHIDSNSGPAVFYHLSSLRPGAKIMVTRSDQSVVTYAVDSAIQVPKRQFPTDQVYGPTPTPQLRLITCGGIFDDAYGHYLDNVVVFASEIPA